MDQPNEERDGSDTDIKPGGCCCGDPFASLPPELRPRSPAKDNGLRQVTCPNCGLVYWMHSPPRIDSASPELQLFPPDA